MKHLKIYFIIIILFCSGDIMATEKTKLTIGLIGDSTVATTYGWGSAFASKFNAQTSVQNFAKNGATLKSLSSKLDELLHLKPDYVLIQFGHNDQKIYGTQEYSKRLKSYVSRIKKAGAKAIVLSSVTRRFFDNSGHILPREEGVKANLAYFAKAAKALAKQEKVPFLDLNTLSVQHHNHIGEEQSATYNFDPEDKTHFSPSGAEAIAALILTQLQLIPKEFNL